MEIRTKEINSKNCVNIRDLFANPNNEKLYQQDAKDLLVVSFTKRKKKGYKVLNTAPISYWSNGMQDEGHTRVKAALEVGEEWLWAEPSDSPMPDSSSPYDEIMHTIDGNTFREKTWSTKLNEFQIAKDAYREQLGVDMPNDIINEHLKRLGTTKKTMDKLAEIKAFKPELMEVVDNGGGIEHNWKDAKGMLDSNIIPAKKNGMNLFKLFDKPTYTKLITKSTTYAKDMRDLKMPFEEFDIEPFSQEPCGKWESGAFSTFFSHTVMSSIAGVLKEKGHNVVTASGHRDDPDIYLKDEDEKIEVKCTQYNGHGASTKWTGGKNIREGKFVLVCFDLTFENVFFCMVDLNKNDWGKPDMNSKKSLTLKSLWENHKNDIEIWKGNIKLVKSNKIPNGQVEMTLDAINEPIK